MEIRVPTYSLVFLLAPPGCDLDRFARRHPVLFSVLTADLGDFRRLLEVVRSRLAARLFTVVNLSNGTTESRRTLSSLAHRYHTQIVTIALHPPAEQCDRLEQGSDSGDDFQATITELAREHYHSLYILEQPTDIEQASIVWQPLPVDRSELGGPFDIIGDVHGCYDELVELLIRLDYQTATDPAAPHGVRVTAPDGRMLVFVGDLVDRGPKVPETLRLAMSVVESGAALCVPGNHDDKLMRALKGRKVKIAHGLEASLEQLSHEPPQFRREVCNFIDGLPAHLVLDGGDLVIAHAGLKESMHGRMSHRIRDYALYGATTGNLDEYGLPERLNWAKDYHGRARVVYGHTPIPRHVWQNRTLNIDTGCVFGGSLSALRYPELELVSVPARKQYAVSARPFLLEQDAAHPTREDDATRNLSRPPA